MGVRGGGGNALYHIMALGAVAVWGTTFVSTKVLLAGGLSPAEIMFWRFVIAYVAMLPFSMRRVFAGSLKDELLFVAAGILGGSLYFLAENTALQYTQAVNVSILISTIPLLTAIFSAAILRSERTGRRFHICSAASLAGVVIVVLNGRFALELNPLGDLLTLVAALSWALYNIIAMQLYGRYSSLFITRKVFFYGLLTLAPFIIFAPEHAPISLLLGPVVAWNLLFLGLAASLGCYVVWNIALGRIGSVRTSNYVYLTPVITCLFSSLILGEQITLYFAVGAAIILSGVYFAQKPPRGREN